MRKFNFLSLLLCLAVIFNFSCVDSEVTKEKKVESVSVNKASAVLYIGDTETLTATVLPAEAENKEVTWVSNDATIAEVDDNGKVTAIAEGTTNITVSSVENPNLKDVCAITVKENGGGGEGGDEVAVESVTVTPEEISLSEGATESLVAEVLPEDATNKELVWTSSDEAIATVDSEGLVTAVAVGEATITATSTDNSEIAASSVVTVTEAPVLEGDTFTLANIPTNGSKIEGNTWNITDSQTGTVADYANLRSALLSAGRSIKVNFVNMKAIAAGAFKYVNPDDASDNSIKYLSSVSGPNVETVEKEAFYYCRSLVAVDFPKLKTIEDFGFHSCDALVDILFKEVEYIGSESFSWCSELYTIKFPKATYVGVRAFAGSNGIIEAQFPEAVTLDTRAFYGCEALAINNFNKVEEVGEAAFAACFHLSRISLPAAKTLGKSAFNSCEALRTVEIPEVTSIGQSCFNWSPIETIVAPKVTYLGSSAFYCGDDISQQSLKNLTIATESTSLEVNFEAFYGAFPEGIALTTGTENGSKFDGLNWIVGENTFGPFKSINGTTPEPQGLTLANIPADGSQIEGDTWVFIDDEEKTEDDFRNLRSALKSAGRNISVEFPKIPSIPEKAFKLTSTETNYLYSFKASMAVTVGASAFDRNTNLRAVSLPAVQCVEMGVFTDCSSLVDVNIPRVELIKDFAFMYCTSLTTIDFENLTTVYGYAFSGCERVKTINLPNLTDTAGIPFENLRSLLTATIATESTVSGFSAPIFGYEADMSFVTLTTGRNNGTSVLEGNVWEAPCSFGGVTTMGPFNRIDLVGEDPNIYVQNLTLNTYSEVVKVGTEIQLEVTISPSAATDKSITWSSSDEAVATVTADGLVSTLSAGIVTITAASVSNPDVTISCNIEVLAEALGNTFTLATIPVIGSLIDDTTWIITDEEAIFADDYARLRAALTSAEAPINVEFPNLNALPEDAFYFTPDVTSYLQTVKAPEVKSLGYAAFYGAANLASVELPKVESVGELAFCQCLSLGAIDLPAATEIAKKAFGHCGIVTASIPQVESIKERTFEACTKLETVSMAALQHIEMWAFSNCSVLANIDMPSLEVVDKWAFGYCTGLKTVNFPKLKSLGAATFKSCTSLTNITLPNLESAESEALSTYSMYYATYTLATESLVKSISADAFYGTALQGVDLVTAEGNGTVVEGTMWTVPTGSGNKEIGPFKSISVQ